MHFIENKPISNVTRDAVGLSFAAHTPHMCCEQTADAETHVV